MDVRPIDAKKAKAVITCELRDVEGFGKYAEGKRAGLLLAKTSVCNPQRTPTLSLNTLRDAIYQDAVAHGLWDDEGIVQGWPLECAALIENEVGELIAAAEDWEYSSFNNNEHFIEELADVVIICFSVAGKLGIDIDAAIRRKMEINKNRSYKHEND